MFFVVANPEVVLEKNFRIELNDKLFFVLAITFRRVKKFYEASLGILGAIPSQDHCSQRTPPCGSDTGSPSGL